MRIHSITARNYRIHRELKVELDTHRTLIGGHNETGKSTLAEAAHRALFLKAKVTGDTQKSMVSTIHGGHPEVELCFEVNGRFYRLLKRFSGTTGTIILAEKDGVTLNGEDAERRLEEILGVAAAGGRNAGERAAEQWAHLWVWQGRAGEDPAKYANTQKEDLLTRLQNAGGAAIMQSELDANLAAQFQYQWEALFTKNGGVKKDSDLGRAAEALQNSTGALRQARETYDRLHQAITDFEEATSAIKLTEEDLRRLLPQKDAVEAKLTRVAELKAQEALQDQEAEAAKEKYERLEKEETRIVQTRREIRTRSDALAPKDTEAQRLADKAAELKSKAQQAEADLQAACETVRGVRLRYELAASHVALFEKTRQRDQISIKAEQVRRVKNELAAFEDKLAKLPAIEAPKLKALQKLEGQCSNAEAALKAMAAGIEVLASKQPVKAGGKKLRTGQVHIIAEEAEVAIGTSTRLRISPGGGTNLIEARNKLQDAREKLQASLDSLGIAGTVEASEAFARRQRLQTDIQACEARLAGLGADTIEEELSEAEQALTACRSDIDRRTSLVENFNKPANLAAAKSLATMLETQLSESESEERTAKLVRDKTLKAQNDAEGLLQSALHSVAEEKRVIGDLQAQLVLLLETHGEDKARSNKLNELLLGKNEATRLLAETCKVLTELQPDLLEADRVRLARAIERTSNAQNDAKEKLAVARSQLQTDGVNDPKSALAQANARAESAQEHFASVQRRAKAIQLLHGLFLDEQRSLADQFSRPLTERISGYLQCVFGADARAHVTLENNSFVGLQLIRPGQGFGSFAFDSLSGGTREQVAAAVRLAMAEVLAQGHEGCLPLVFDDAFANSDPDRVQILQRMLDLAAGRGLQIIILTCNPSDYAALGAKQISLRPESRLTSPIPVTAPAQEAVASVEPFNGQPPASIPFVAASEEQCQILLSVLQKVGGSSGNHSLRQALAWDERTYDAAKAKLVAAGRLALGRGKGGSVILVPHAPQGAAIAEGGKSPGSSLA